MLESYKKGEGVITRRVAFWSLAALLIWAGQGIYTFVLRWDWAKKLLVEDGPPSEGFEIPVFGQRFDLGFVLAWGFVIGSLLVLRSLLNRPKVAEFLIETDAELGKVTWPTWRDAWNSTVVVIIFVLFFTAFLFGSDFVLNRLVKLLLGVDGGDS